MQLKLTTPNAKSGLKDLTRALEAVLQGHRLDRGLVHDVLVIAEEVVGNVIEHGYDDNRPREITVDVDRDDRLLTLEFRDDARPFNPLERTAPDCDEAIESRPLGGLGILLVQELAESISYRRHDAHNILRVVLRLPV